MSEKYTVEEIKRILQQDVVDEVFIDELKQDGRTSVQKLLKQYENKIQKEYDEFQKFITMSIYENELRYSGIELIAGVDEVGRGPLAGPVIAAAVILPADCWLFGIDDSKKLSESKRLYFYEQIKKNAISIGIGICTSEEIDQYNIYEATKIAMERAVSKLNPKPQHLLLDAMSLPRLDIPQTSIIKGDSKSVSIAAASIIAKVTRDAYMKKLGSAYPQYGFERHVGYGTKEHLLAIEQHGIISEHRKSFEPIRSKFN
ncbi:ribonuclease HII [Turicibacter sanguinis]|jgi:ribonuclease HII|uniref:Ribonuclease HII n=2 Tax=Turicibacter sanguinis TaxID=154288 RepID=A0A9X5ANW9_9FIRM|nr:MULTISPECIES: ribonuclease HII [Turicibacter]EFF64633.1 ribonuclease HII [Turicibacter sanguinis PC909]EGC92588.1 ribonuclease HII [Turicibacter sp. HGF1]MCU7191281.1 ribonuclease HII [Turicibacter sanguinis]MCU7196159.1 ribonuclease HII [Turicibacter sanguinis]MCU7200681.1 ribonuclease HII [Turicibacter sanguinis]